MIKAMRMDVIKACSTINRYLREEKRITTSQLNLVRELADSLASAVNNYVEWGVAR